MFMKRIAIGAVAAAAFSLTGYAVSAAPVTEAGAASIYHSPVTNPNSTFTLIRRGGSGSGGGVHMGGARVGGPGIGGTRAMVRPRGSIGGTRTMVRPGRIGGERAGFREGRRRFRRDGRWFWGGVDVDSGGSCYWNCINAGYGPGYCRVYAYDFCY
jgi:hypothetical protein